MEPQIHTDRSRAFAGTLLRNGETAANGTAKFRHPDLQGNRVSRSLVGMARRAVRLLSTDASVKPARQRNENNGQVECLAGKATVAQRRRRPHRREGGHLCSSPPLFLRARSGCLNLSPEGAPSNSPGQASAPPWILKNEEPCPEWSASQNVLNLAPFGPDSAGPASNLARAFSLLELLVVISIMGLLMALVGPPVQSALKANAISGGGQVVADQLIFARQEAITKNGDVETRLYKFDDPNDASPNEVMRALQSFRVKADGTREPLGRLVRMPNGAVISTNAALSGVFGPMSFQKPGSQDPNLAGVGKNYSWLGFLFHADGSMNLPQDSSSRTNNFLTIVSSTDPAPVPANYYSIMIESRNGRIKVFRP